MLRRNATKDYSMIYNTLPSVEEADSEVSRNDFKDKAHFLKEVSRLLRKHNLQQKLGIALLHKHCKVREGERMVESPEIVNGEKALVTKPIRSVSNIGVPTVWSIEDGQYHPLEYTTDTLACDLFNESEIPIEFLSDFAALSDSSPIGRYLGLAVVERAFYNDNEKQQQIPLEYSNFKNRHNVVFLKRQCDLRNTIQTAWSFKEDNDVTLECESKSYCIARCQRQCWSEPDGHRREHVGRHGVSYEHKYT